MNFQGNDADSIILKANSEDELQKRIKETTARLIVHHINYQVEFAPNGDKVHCAIVIAGKRQLLMEG